MITDADWTSLLTSIFEYNECTPFLGAGACIPFFPSGQQLAEKWAAEASYPFHHKDLSEVAQFIAVNSGGKAAKFKMDQALKEFSKPVRSLTSIVLRRSTACWPICP